MARNLDPKLLRIIEDASRNTQSSDSSDAPHSSVIPADFTHTPLNRHLGRRQVSTQPALVVSRFQSARSALDDFDRDVLRSDDASRHLDSNSSLSRLAFQSGLAYNNRNVTNINPPPIYGHWNTQQPQPVDERKTCIPALRPTAVVESPQRTQVESHESKAIFHGIGNRNSSQVVHYGPRTPLRLNSYGNNTPVTVVTTPPAQEFSSPTARISLRRANHALISSTLPVMSRSTFEEAFEEELFLNSLSQSQKNVSMVQEPARSHYIGQPPTVQGISLVSPNELPDRFRQVFPYGLFNAVQSKCFSPIYRATDNVVVAAPTGSGKTALLELAICKLIQEFGSEQFKIVYQAPTKSLCSERLRDWEKKFSHLNLPCVELTGDTDNSELRKVGNAVIIITTPEKWDSITRKWKDHVKLLQLVKLVLIDEVHILKDPRGATLEAVVSRMKSIGANVRFVALSATVPNSEDIAKWLGKDHTNGHLPAYREIFGEEFRPVKLQKHVYGFSANINDFAFDSFLDTKLPGLIAKHTARKPIMVFCVTRKICESTAMKLTEWWSSLRVTERPWPTPQRKVTVGSPELRELVGCGVAFHHAGLDAQDRSAVETGFLRNELSVICCTSTLAVGVNLPCHLVVIKNTVCYKDDGLSEYSDLEVMQMLGRAGRPQFDDSAVAIIMTRCEKVDRYKLMISGQEILESTLHLNLIEHLNSEIGLGTVHDVYSAKRWLAGTFLSVRMRVNPTYYKFSCDTGSRDPDERLEGVCERDIELLKTAKLITKDQRFMCTDYGKAMSKYMVQFETMKLLLSIPKGAKMTQILHLVSQSSEFKGLRLKPNERGSFRDFNKSPFIKSPIKENISTFAHKVSLITQVYLGGVDLPMDKEFNTIKRQFQLEKSIIFERMLRLMRCVVECKANDCDAVGTCNALELLRSIAAGFWENSTLQLRQLPAIGPAGVRKLVHSNVKTVAQLASLDSAAIERALSRNPPFGKKILDSAINFPRLSLQAEINKKIIKMGEPVKVQVRAQIGYLNAKFPAWNRKAPVVTFTASLSNDNLAHIWRGSLKKAEKGLDLNFTCALSRPSDIIVCHFACEEIVGTIRSVELRPEIPASAFPPPNPILPPAKAKPDRAPAKTVLSAQEEAEIFAALEAENSAEERGTGSDYGGDSVFDDFVDIDDFKRGVDVEKNDDTAIPEPVRMENGKWRCNHKCRDAQGNYLSRTGAPCKHLCCREGIDKPRKTVKKKTIESNAAPKRAKGKVTKSGSTNDKKPPSKNLLKLKLKLADHEESFQEIEAIDLAEGVLEAESTFATPRQYPPTPGVLSLEGKPGSVRLSEKAPQYPYASGLQRSLSLIGPFGYEDRSSPDFPLPSVLLGNEDPFDYHPKENIEIVTSRFSEHEGELPADDHSPSLIESFENSAFDFNGFETLETPTKSPNASSSKKRAGSPSTTQPEVKLRRVLGESVVPQVGDNERMLQEQVRKKLETKKPLPSWVAELDQDLIDFFGDSVEYKE